MSLRRLRLETSWGLLDLVGGSRAGEGTLILLPQMRLGLDPGRAHRALPPMSTLTLSHGHVDHLGGLAYWASQRFLNSMGPGRVIVPSPIADQVAELLAVHSRLEGGDPYETEVLPADEGAVIPLKGGLELGFFPTDHWVPTLGTRVWWRRHRLLPELAHLAGEEIARRRAVGDRVTEDLLTPLLSYCADSGPRLLADRPEVMDSEILLIECSFFRPGDRDRARRYGHMHLEDLGAVLPQLGCRHLVVLHASRRHRLREVEEILGTQVQPATAAQVHHLIIDWT